MMTQKTKEAVVRRRQFQKKLNQKDSSLFIDLPKGLIILTIIMVFAQVLVSNIFGVKGAELVELEEEKNSLTHEKTVLENQIYELSSLSRIEKACYENLTMKKADKNVIYLPNESLASIK